MSMGFRTKEIRQIREFVVVQEKNVFLLKIARSLT